MGEREGREWEEREREREREREKRAVSFKGLEKVGEENKRLEKKLHHFAGVF